MGSVPSGDVKKSLVLVFWIFVSFVFFFLHHLYLETREITEFHMGGWSSKNCFDHRPICVVPHLVAVTVFCWACYHLWLSFLVQPSDQCLSGLLQATKCLSTTSWKPLKCKFICLTEQQQPLEEWSSWPGILRVCGPSHKYKIAYTLIQSQHLHGLPGHIPSNTFLTCAFPP